jgi:hypothetical protein
VLSPAKLLCLLHAASNEVMIKTRKIFFLFELRKHKINFKNELKKLNRFLKLYHAMPVEIFSGYKKKILQSLTGICIGEQV